MAAPPNAFIDCTLASSEEEATNHQPEEDSSEEVIPEPILDIGGFQAVYDVFENSLYVCWDPTRITQFNRKDGVLTYDLSRKAVRPGAPLRRTRKRVYPTPGSPGPVVGPPVKVSKK